MPKASNELSLKFEDTIVLEVPSDDSTAAEEKRILYDEIRKYKPEVVVETGTHRGLTSLYMAHALYDNKKGHLHTADPFEWGAAGNFRKIPELEARITYYPTRGSEMIAQLENIDFAFIDGFHEAFEVVEELKVLLPKLRKGAVVYFHDTNGRNPSCDVPGGIEEMGLEVEYIKTQNGMAKYVHK